MQKETKYVWYTLKQSWKNFNVKLEEFKENIDRHFSTLQMNYYIGTWSSRHYDGNHSFAGLIL
jgi:hypothetical protein